jgi:hypothetical protein
MKSHKSHQSQQHQVFVYFDNLEGHSSNRIVSVYNGNTLAGLHEFVLDNLPYAVPDHVRIEYWDKPFGYSHRKQCGPLFSKEEKDVHVLFRTKTTQ